MSWGRGLLRLLIVLSMLWVATIAFTVIEDVSALLGDPEFRTDISLSEVVIAESEDGVVVISTENGRSLEFETGGVVKSMNAEWQVMLDAAVEKLNAQNNALNNAYKERGRRARAHLYNALRLGLLPPLCLFVLGWSILWALRGFKGDTI